ncbi:Uncharacterised protein [Shigella sonnei]|nr:Uncharacterised protein [Shigella sonnei]
MHSGVAVTQRCSAYQRRTIPKTRSGCRATRCLSNVFIGFYIHIRRTLIKPFDRTKNQTWIDFLNMLPGEAHVINGPWMKVLD